jgi:mannose-6-phosphate isomerase-like protein (cupin superfamily)
MEIPTERHQVLVRAGSTRRPDGTEELTTSRIVPPWAKWLADQQTVVRSFDSEGRLAAFVIPVAEHEVYRGAPLHVHHEQDEWIYILAGEFVAEVGGKRIRLKPGDSLLMPMKIPHRWSSASQPRCGAIHLYTPAGLMDVFFDPAANSNAPQTPEQLKAEVEKYGMTLLGIPLTKEEIDQTA